MLDHRACVESLAELPDTQASPERLRGQFEARLDAIWRRAVITLGEVTMGAIVGRVFYTASELHPSLGALRVSSTGIDYRGLEQQAGHLDPQDLALGINFILVELLTVIGTLTAEILTPALHEALSTATAPVGIPHPEGSNARKPTDEF